MCGAPVGTTAAPVASKKKVSTGSIVTLIICIILNIFNYIISVPVMLYTGLLAFIAPFGMMIGAYYEEAYLAAFLTFGISTLAAAAASIGIASSCANCAISKKGANKGKAFLKVLPFVFTGASFLLNVISLIVIGNIVM